MDVFQLFSPFLSFPTPSLIPSHSSVRSSHANLTNVFSWYLLEASIQESVAELLLTITYT